MKLLLIILLIPALTNAKVLYEENFEYLDTDHVFAYGYLYPWPMNYNLNKQNYHGNCFRTTNGYRFNNFLLDSKTPFEGKRSWKVTVDTAYLNNMSTGCPHKWMQTEAKSRNEIVPGHRYNTSQVSPPWGEVEFGDQPYWYSYAFYIPKDQPGLSTWIHRRTPRGIITQFLGAKNSATPEVHFMLGGDKDGIPYISMEVTWSEKEHGEDNHHAYYGFKPSFDEWHTLIVYRQRDWKKGILKVYLDCHKVSIDKCVAIVDHHGGNAIRDKPVSIFKFGNYRSDKLKIHQIIKYDRFMVHDRRSNLADVVEAYRVSSVAKPMAPVWSM